MLKKIKYFILFLGFSLFGIKGALANENPYVDLLGTTTGEGTVTAGQIMASDYGNMIKFIIGLLVVMFIVSIVVGILFWAKSHSKH